MDQKLFDEMVRQMRSDKGNVTARMYFVNAENNVQAHGNTACHAQLDGYGGIHKSPMIGCRVTFIKQNDKTAQDYLQWLVSEESFYHPLIKYLGKDFHVIKKKEDIIGFIITRTDINTKVFQNFCKATRSCREHVETLDFWKKWAMQKRVKNKSLVFLLSYFFSNNGTKRSRGHSVFSVRAIDLKRFLDINHKDWKLDEKTINNGCSYHGENEYVFGGKVPVYSLIQKIKVREMKTKFWGKYQNDPSYFQDECFEAFFNNPHEAL